MFLLHIYKNKLEKNHLQRITYLKNLIEKIRVQTLFLKDLKQTRDFKSLRLLLAKAVPKNRLVFKSKSLVNYIIGISIYNTSIVLYLTDVKGTVKFFVSSGFLGIKRKQKKKKVAVLIKLIKFLLLKVKFISGNDQVALHLKNFNERLGSFALAFLSKFYNIELVRINANQPHNGCRPRKIKRKKRRNLNFDKKS